MVFKFNFDCTFFAYDTINFDRTEWYLVARLGNKRGRKGWKIGTQKFVTRLQRSQNFPKMKLLKCTYAITMVFILVCGTQSPAVITKMDVIFGVN